MKSRTEVARPQPAPGALVMLTRGGRGRGPEPGSSAERHLSGARGWCPARPALIYTFQALPLSLLGPRKEGGDFRSQ